MGFITFKSSCSREARQPSPVEQLRSAAAPAEVFGSGLLAYSQQLRDPTVWVETNTPVQTRLVYVKPDSGLNRNADINMFGLLYAIKSVSVCVIPPSPRTLPVLLMEDGGVEEGVGSPRSRRCRRFERRGPAGDHRDLRGSLGNQVTLRH